MQTEKKSLYDRVGGEEAVTAVVDTFYAKILADPLLAFYFAKTDMKKQKKHQTLFLMLVFGGPNKFNGRTLRNVHKNLDINDKHFDAVAGHLKTALEDHKISEDIIKEALDIVEGTRSDILNK